MMAHAIFRHSGVDIAKWEARLRIDAFQFATVRQPPTAEG